MESASRAHGLVWGASAKSSGRCYSYWLRYTAVRSVGWMEHDRNPGPARWRMASCELLVCPVWRRDRPWRTDLHSLGGSWKARA